jgi:hypothetical protein
MITYFLSIMQIRIVAIATTIIKVIFQILFKTRIIRIRLSASSRGEYIFQNLRLYLKRHKLIWALAILEKKKLQLDESLDAMPTNDSNELKILR